jgi:hypothetical protein
MEFLIGETHSKKKDGYAMLPSSYFPEGSASHEHQTVMMGIAANQSQDSRHDARTISRRDSSLAASG